MTIVIAANTPSTEKPTLLIENILTEGDLTVSSETSDGAGLNALSDTTFDFWTPSATNARLDVDMGEAVTCDAVGIAAHTLGTDGASFRVRSSNTGFTDLTTRIDHSPLTDDTIIGLFQSVSARYWRFQIYNGPASIGVVKIGKRVIVPTGVLLGHVGANHGERIELLSNDSINGQFLGTRVIRRSAEINIDFGLVSKEFVENDLAMFEYNYNQGRTFFYAGSPANLPNDIGYCKRPSASQELRPNYEGGDLMQLDFEAQVYVG